MSEATNMEIVNKCMCCTHHSHGSCMITGPEFPLVILTWNSVNHTTCTWVVHCIYSLECNTCNIPGPNKLFIRTDCDYVKWVRLTGNKITETNWMLKCCSADSTFNIWRCIQGLTLAAAILNCLCAVSMCRRSTVASSDPNWSLWLRLPIRSIPCQHLFPFLFSFCCASGTMTVAFFLTCIH